MSYYKYHVFFCCNQRPDGETCCNNHGAVDAQTYAKERIAELKLKGRGKIRINNLQPTGAEVCIRLPLASGHEHRQKREQ